ncbi:hypothetical protein Tco_0531046 [Tanacetum coccineum]
MHKQKDLRLTFGDKVESSWLEMDVRFPFPCTDSFDITYQLRNKGNGNSPRKGLQGQKEAKTVKNRQRTKETRTRVKKQPEIKSRISPTQQERQSKAQLVENGVVRVIIPKCMSWLDAYDEPIGDLDMMEDKVDNPSPQCTPQVLPSFKVYTPPVTYLEETHETIGIPIEVKPLDHMKLEDLGLNTCSHDLFPNSREFPSVDEPEPQLLPNLPFLDVNLEDKRGTDPPINLYSPGSFRMKVIFDEKKLGSS